MFNIYQHFSSKANGTNMTAATGSSSPSSDGRVYQELSQGEVSLRQLATEVLKPLSLDDRFALCHRQVDYWRNILMITQVATLIH